MNRNQAKEFYPIMQAYAEGKVIECRTKPSALSKSWQDMNDWTEMEELMAELLFDIFLFSCTTAIGFIIGYYSRK